jgi:ferredoxin
MASFFESLGHPSVGVISNEVYRDEDGIKLRDMKPDLSHRLVAVRSGVGWFGYSGNVMVPEFGANTTLCTMVTTAELEPTDALPAEENLCKCETKECVAVCPSAFMHVGKDELETVTMGGETFTYALRRNYDRCSYVCAGYSGLHPSGRWSTWSPGRFPVPKDDTDLWPVVKPAVRAWAQRPYMQGHTLQQPLLYQSTHKDVQLSCGACMLVCAADPEERERRLKSVQNAGVAIQHPDGSVEMVPPEEAEKHVAAMDPETRALYEPPDFDVFEGIDMMGRSDKS